ncbi:MAG: ThiF family adenylyltransferase [Chloroflexi bacterium]|nr:ThiF family adenylyltransferase [Chloroflexota bacterium]
MPYKVDFRFNSGPRILIIGCGGTGSLLADGLCRLLTGLPEVDLLLIDPDRVEEHNLLRQAFHAGDVGKFKSQAFAERLSRQYGRKIAYSVLLFDKDLAINSDLGRTFYQPAASMALVIGCVDSSAARRQIAGAIQFGNWWLDSGNGYNSGQVLFGNVGTKERLIESFNEREGTVTWLSMPGIQLTELLTTPAKRAPQRDCAEAIALEDQSPVINQAMAMLALEFVRRLLRGELSWMGAYLDLDAGTLRTVPAEPVTVAKMFSMKESDLMVKEKKKGGKP